MTRVPLPLLLSLALVLGMAAAPATAETETEPCLDEEGEPTFTEEINWIKAPDHKLGNLGATGEVAYPTWSDEEPATSVTGGAGGGSLQSRGGNPTGSEYDPAGSGHFEGTFTGCIDTIAFDLYVLMAALGDDVVTKSRLYIDGTPIFVDSSDPAMSFPVESAGDTGALYRMRFAYTDIYEEMSRWQQDFEPLESEHTITLTLFSQYVNPEQQSVYVYDTTEAPSSVTFNTYDLASYAQMKPGG